MIKLFKIKRWGLAIALLLLMRILLLQGCVRQTSSDKNQVCHADICFDVEVVQKADDLKRGLQHRKFLAEKNGMLFIFNEGRHHGFWMKDTFIPLDIIWMDYARRVIHIEHEVPPCTADPCPVFSPDGEALYVLEVNARQASKWKIKEGDRLEFRLKEFQ